MPKRTLGIEIVAVAALGFFSIMTQAQTNTPIINVGGLATNGLGTPTRPTGVTASTGCGTGHTYAYEVAGVDFNGGLTSYSNASAPAVTC